MSTRPERVYSDKGVVLRTYKLGESDRIVVLLTEANGKVRAVAKGVRKTKSRFGSRLEPLSHVSVLLYRGRELDVVNQVEPLEPAGPLRNNLDKMTQGIAMLEAVDQLTLDREPVPHVYAMLVGALRELARRRSWLRRFTGSFSRRRALPPNFLCVCRVARNLKNSKLTTHLILSKVAYSAAPAARAEPVAQRRCICCASFLGVG